MATKNDGSSIEREAVRTTIVGGRPPGSGKSNCDIPRGIEVLVKKASVDAAFCDTLLTKRAAAANQIGLELDAAETAMLAVIPESQLIGIIQNTRVSPRARPAFMGYAAAAMLAALGVNLGTVSTTDATEPPATDTAVGDYYEEIEVRFAVQPDDGYLDNIDLYTGIVEGFVETIDHVIVPGANVIILGTDFFAEADEDGYFKIEGLPPGEYRIEARDDEGAEINKGGVTVIAGTIAEVHFTKKVKGPVTGSRPDLP